MASILKVNEIQNTGGTSAITVDTNGRVVNKLKSCFTAGLASSTPQTISTVTKINFVSNGNLFQQIDANNDFDNANNRFVAPVTGVYFFQLSFYDGTSGQDIFGAQLYIDGARKQNFTWHKVSSPTAESFSGGTAIYNMTANSYAEVYAVPSGSVTIADNPYHTFWMGYLVGQI